MSDTTINPPDNLVVVTGTWGTDITEDLVTHLSGGRAIKFLNTTPAADPVVATAQFIPCDGGRSYTFDATLRADSVVAGNTVAVSVYWYDVTQTYISGTSIYASAVLPAANEWVFVRANAAAPSTARYAKLVATKNNTAFSAWLDSWAMNPAVPFGLYSKASQSISTTTNTAFVFDTVTEEIAMSMNTGTGELTLLEPGIYIFHLTLISESLDNGAYARLQTLNGLTLAGADYFYNWSGDAWDLYSTTSGMFSADAGDVITVKGYHNDASSLSMDCKLRIARVA